MFKSSYFYRARLFPALLTCIPLVIFINKILAVEYYDALKNVFDLLPFLTHLGLSAALIFLCVQVNRVLAKEIFQRAIFKGELYMPSTNHLLWKSTFFDPIVTKKIRDKMAEKFGIYLLSPEEEVQNEIKARNLIATCVSQVRVLLRGNSMLLQHNIEYGFWRNLIGGSLLSVLFSVAIFIYGIINGFSDLITIGTILIGVYLTPILMGKTIIRKYGNYYSKILYEQFLGL